MYLVLIETAVILPCMSFFILGIVSVDRAELMRQLVCMRVSVFVCAFGSVRARVWFGRARDGAQPCKLMNLYSYDNVVETK